MFQRLFPPAVRSRVEIIEEMPPVPTVKDTTPYDPDRGAGRDFNIVLAVQDHAPARLKEIAKLINDHEQSVQRLKVEAIQLRRLLAAVNVKKKPAK